MRPSIIRFYDFLIVEIKKNKLIAVLFNIYTFFFTLWSYFDMKFGNITKTNNVSFPEYAFCNIHNT